MVNHNSTKSLRKFNELINLSPYKKKIFARVDQKFNHNLIINSQKKKKNPNFIFVFNLPNIIFSPPYFFFFSFQNIPITFFFLVGDRVFLPVFLFLSVYFFRL